MRLEENVECMGHVINTLNILARISEWKRPYGRPKLRWGDKPEIETVVSSIPTLRRNPENHNLHFYRSEGIKYQMSKWISKKHESTDLIKFVPCNDQFADHSGRTVWGINCLRSLEHWDHGFESHSRYGCLRLFCVCVSSGLATDWSTVQESYRLS
jgi:hypothetical protein